MKDNINKIKFFFFINFIVTIIIIIIYNIKLFNDIYIYIYYMISLELNFHTFKILLLNIL